MWLENSLILSLLSVTTLCAASHVAQAPFGWSPGPDAQYEDATWDLAQSPVDNATGNLIFRSASSLMQKWGNTRYRNGHTIIPGTIAPGTILTHGTWLNDTPHMPEWTATDPEHSYLFCWGANETGCGHATFAATRPLKVLYFDGSSAAKMAEGEFDTQDVIQFRAIITSNWTFYSERERIHYFCEWGKPFGIDGFVRMQMDFEVMLCSFTDGVELVSFDKLVPVAPLPKTPMPTPSAAWAAAVPTRPAPPGRPLPRDPPRLYYEIVFAGDWHNYFPGDTRIRLDYSRMMSFYDTSLAPSLISVRAGKERWEHRLKGISKDDIDAAMWRLEETLLDPSPGSGIDWESLLHVIVNRYAGRLELIQHLLNTIAQRGERETAQTVQAQLRVMLTPYILASVRPPNGSTDTRYSWASPSFKLCATMHTAQIAKPPLIDELTYSDRVLLQAVQETSRGICRVVTNMWAEGVLQKMDSHFPGDAVEESQVHALLLLWRKQLDSLMKWLDWDVWVKCRPACSADEDCYLPTWPFFIWSYDPDWERPKPRCIRRAEPFGEIWP